jgi:molybdopterin biosynthesis enzyme
VEAISEDYISNPGGARRFVWVTVEKREDTLLARPASAQVKEILVSISRADGLAVIPEQTVKVKPGDKLAVRLLDWH